MLQLFGSHVAQIGPHLAAVELGAPDKETNPPGVIRMELEVFFSERCKPSLDMELDTEIVTNLPPHVLEAFNIVQKHHAHRPLLFPRVDSSNLAPENHGAGLRPQQRSNGLGDADLHIVAPQVEEGTRVNHVELGLEIHKCGSGIQNIGCEELAWQLASIPEKLVSQFDKVGLEVAAIYILCWRPAMHQLTHRVAEAARHIQQLFAAA